MIAKELRALLPVWAATAAAMLASALIRELRPFSVPAYYFGAIALGATSMGHDLSHRTLSLMLTQPISRGRMLLTKLTVLAALLLSLLLLSFVVLSVGRGEAVFGQAIRWLPVLAALFITPYLTLASRSPMGGAVFTLGITGLLLIGGEWLGALKYGSSANVDSFRAVFLSRMLLALSAAGAVMTWWTFSRLEVIDGPGTEIDFARFAPAAVPSQTVTRRNPVWLLIQKELRLQQLAFVIAALFVAIYFVALSRNRGMFAQNDGLFAVSLLYAVAIAVLIGSVASAEERNLRTIEAQLLLPVSASRQWSIKIATVLGLTLVLAVLLPAGLAALFPPERILWARALNSLLALSSVLALLSVAALSLYVSTLCSSSLWALMCSVPAGLAVMVFVLKIGGTMEGYVYRLGGRLDRAIVGWSAALVVASVIGLVLRFGLANHRQVDRSHWRTAAHVGITGVAIAVAAALIGVAAVLSR